MKLLNMKTTTALVWRLLVCLSLGLVTEVCFSMDGARPISELLKPDGRIDTTKFQGSVDPSGYQMIVGESGPRFVARSTDAANSGKWQTFGSTLDDCNLNVNSMALLPDGKLLVGGFFSLCGNTYARNLATWDGHNWREFEGGTNDSVRAIAVDAGNVFVAGRFTHVGAIAANRIAKWNPAQGWSALANGLDGNVQSIAVGVDGVYVGGQFSSAGAVAANNIARWQNEEWHVLGNAAQNGVDNCVNDLAVQGETLFVGGCFRNASGVPAFGIAQWRGQQWHEVLAPGDVGGFSWVSRLLASNGKLYALGDLYLSGVLRGRGIAQWDGQSWSGLGAGIAGTGTALSLSAQGILTVAGEFDSAGDVAVTNIAQWNGQAWRALTGNVNGISGAISSIVQDGKELIIGGEFSSTFAVSTSSIVRWSPEGYHLLESEGLQGVRGEIRALAVDGNDVYVGGSFTQLGRVKARHIGKWDGQRWQALGSGANNAVTSILVVKDAANPLLRNTVFVGGYFSEMNGISANYLAKWNGSEWSAVSSDIVFGSNVYALATNGSNLFVGGNFNQIGQIPANNIASWDGSQWSALSVAGQNGTNWYVQLLEWHQDELYLAGGFSAAGGMLGTNCIARWNAGFHALGTGIVGNCNVNALKSVNQNLIVGGRFSSAGASSGPNIASWTNGSWRSLGSDFGVVKALAVLQNQLVASVQDAPASLMTWDAELAQWRPFSEQHPTSAPLAMAETPNGAVFGGDFKFVVGGQPLLRPSFGFAIFTAQYFESGFE
jgi:trimeric autotransporter adhesin